MSKVHEFANKVVETLKSDYDVDCIVKEVVKNGVTFVGIQPEVSLLPEKSILPLVYVESFVDKGVEASVEQIYRMLTTSYPTGMDTITTMLMDIDYVSRNVYCCVESRSATEKSDGSYYYEPVGDWDLNMYYRITFNLENDLRGSFRVTTQILDKWESMNYPIHKLHEDAVRNTIESAEIMPMDVAVASLLANAPEGEDIPETPFMYVASNVSKYLGAGVIYCDEVLDKMCEEAGCDDIVILPSSIHEVIFLPKSHVESEEEIDFLNKTIQDINACVVNPEEILSDHVYMWHKN